MRGVIACVWLVATPAAGFAQPGWFDLAVPGSLERVLGREVSVPERPRLLRELIVALRDVESAPANRAADAFRTCLAELQQLRARWLAVERAAGEVSLGAAAQDGAGRRALETLLDLFDLRMVRDGSTWRAGTAREDVRRPGVCGAGRGWRSTAVEQRLNAGEALDWNVPHFVVPLPLSPGFWLELVYGERAAAPATAAVRAEIAADLLGRLLTDTRTAQLYLGLAALDGDTLAWLERRPRPLLRLDDEGLAAFARFGGSLRVRDSIVHTPGGAGAVSFWERLVDASADDPERFVERLFERSSGRVAQAYDLVARLPDRHRQFVLGAWRPDARDRRRGLATLWRILETLPPPDPVFANPGAVRPADVDFVAERQPGPSLCGIPPGEAVALSWELDVRLDNVPVGGGRRPILTSQNRIYACSPRRCTYRGYPNEPFALEDAGVDLGRDGFRYACQVQAVMDFPNEYHDAARSIAQGRAGSNDPELERLRMGIRRLRTARLYRLGYTLSATEVDRRELMEGPQ